MLTSRIHPHKIQDILQHGRLTHSIVPANTSIYAMIWLRVSAARDGEGPGKGRLFESICMTGRPVKSFELRRMYDGHFVFHHQVGLRVKTTSNSSPTRQEFTLPSHFTNRMSACRPIRSSPFQSPFSRKLVHTARNAPPSLSRS